MNKKTLGPIIITAVVSVVLIAAFFLIRMIPDSGSSEASPSPSAPSASTVVYLYQEDYYDLKRMEFDFRDSEDIVIEIDDSTDVRVFNFSPAKEGWAYSQTKMRSTAFNIISVSAIATAAENVTDFSEYELDKPQLVARSYYDKNGEEVVWEIHFGKMTAVEDSYYARKKGDSTVYVISKHTVDTLLTPELKYRELNFFPSYLSDDQINVEAAGFITDVRIRNEAKNSDIAIRMRTDEELKTLEMGSTRYVMTVPIEVQCNDTAVEDKLINIAAAIEISDVVEDNPKDLSQYGLDEPLDIWMTNTEGDEIHYLVGDSSGASAYVMVEGVDTVLLANKFSPSLRDLNYVDFMFKLFWIHNIDDVESVVFDIEGDKSFLEIKANERKDGKVVNFEAVLDGRPITEINTRRLYSRMLNMMIIGETTEQIDIETRKADIILTINMKDGSVETLELYALNERQYAGSVNGAEAVHYINVSNVKRLKEAFDYIARGEEIPR